LLSPLTKQVLAVLAKARQAYLLFVLNRLAGELVTQFLCQIPEMHHAVDVASDEFTLASRAECNSKDSRRCEHFSRLVRPLQVPRVESVMRRHTPARDKPPSIVGHCRGIKLVRYSDVSRHCGRVKAIVQH
jgi:hypothetical protein